ncbi:UNVERIFIED_CONTAM: Retrovirus-related Pol polyprotein from transposon RE1 [Sesamum radiatum]|uniref:Retrovirus-related Pol polyprotein from transposon RE1 n=1 Tax=Sesamum radiatum TaxID=300843 RepID=A0AAW2TII7_SESRA
MVVVVVEVKEDEALLTLDVLLKIRVLIIVFVGKMAMIRTGVGVNAKSVKMQTTLNEIVGIKKTVRRKMPPSPRKETSEPQNFDEAAKEKVWQKATDEEIACIEKNHTWDLVDLPDEKNIISVKWINKTKYKEDSSIQKHKVRLVTKGYSQQFGVDFTETFAPVARMETIRIVLAISAQLGLPVYQLDVKLAFLNG